jgi:hypothetical protein
MAIRNSNTPHEVRPKLPKSRNMRTALYVGGAVVAGAGVLIGVHVATSSGGGGVSVSAAPASISDAAASPVGGAAYAGSLELNDTASELTSWNATSKFCTEDSWEVADGTVATDSNGDATLTTTGKTGSCVAMISPGTVSSGVVEVAIDLPAVPGKSSTIADWTSVWLTNQATWPVDGELDAVEAEPATGKNAVSYHWGTQQSEQSVSTDGFAKDGNLPVKSADLTPGWHVVDVVYTKGFFAVYYDGKLFTTAQASAITGAPVNLIISSSVTPATKAVEQTLGGTAPLNSDSSPANIAVKYVKVWTYK